MAFFDSLLGAGANLLGGLLNRQSQEKINRENIDNANAARSNTIPLLVSQAKAAGINPLAALGQTLPGPAVAVGDSSLGSGVASAGQDIGRAANALSEQAIKGAQLDNKLKEIAVADAAGDFVAKTKVASDIQKRHGQPGTISVPLPRARSDVLKPLYQTFDDGRGGIVELPTGDASTAMQNWASLPAQLGVAAGEAGRSAHEFLRSSGRLVGSAARSVFPPFPPYW